MVFVMHSRREPHPDTRGPDNVDRRKGFLDIVERLGQGVVAVGHVEPEATKHSGDQPTGEPRTSPLRKTDEP